MQVPINHEVGNTFPKVLRAFLRQDPDIMLIGEIRDLETAEVAIQAALTGHLVFSTLHTNDAAGAVMRFVDMNVAPYMVASTLEAVLGQRLLRTCCRDCKTPYDPDDETLDRINLTRDEIGPTTRRSTASTSRVTRSAAARSTSARAARPATAPATRDARRSSSTCA